MMMVICYIVLMFDLNMAIQLIVHVVLYEFSFEVVSVHLSEAFVLGFVMDLFFVLVQIVFVAL